MKTEEIPEQNMNDFFKYLKQYCKDTKKEKYVQ